METSDLLLKATGGEGEEVKGQGLALLFLPPRASASVCVPLKDPPDQSLGANSQLVSDSGERAEGGGERREEGNEWATREIEGQVRRQGLNYNLVFLFVRTVVGCIFNLN